MRKAKGYGTALFLLLLAAPAAFGHVTISPRESQVGRQETYTMRVPTERDSPTVRIEAEFPAEAIVTALPAKPGWQIESRSGPGGGIVGAVWSGASIEPGQAEEFRFVARNPSEPSTLVWKVIQIHADGSRAEWVGEPGSRGPAPVTEVGPEVAR